MALEFKHLQGFRRDLWKDQRVLEVRGGPEPVFRKHISASSPEADVLEYLAEHATVARVPRLRGQGRDYVDLEYVRGIRLFNLLVELRSAPPACRGLAEAWRRTLLDEAELSQREIQRLLVGWKGAKAARPYDVGEKIGSIVEILTAALDITYDAPKVREELSHLAGWWRDYASIPFRDATPKNMVVALPQLWLGNFESESHRRAALIRSLELGVAEPWFEEGVLIDFDFASCRELTSPEDDPVSLFFHESTYGARPLAPGALSWSGAADAERLAVTFIVRYFRFGGRKAAYRFAHPSGSANRFRHDEPAFYFRKLPQIVQQLAPRVFAACEELMTLSRHLATAVARPAPSRDEFLESGLAAPRRYYVDMYPM